MRDWVTRFGLSKDPFDERETLGFYYGGPYGVASLRIEQALRQRRGYVVVTGEAGLGKTLLVRSVLSRREVFATASISCAKSSPSSVIEQMLIRAEPFAGSFSATRRRAALLSMVEQAKLAEKPIVFIIEDAHLADPVQLEDLRVALNLDASVNDVVQVILIGRLRLADTLATRTLRELTGQVVATVTLARMTTDECVEFLRDRVAEGGAERAERVFTKDAIMAIARHSEGVITKCTALARESLKRAAGTDAQIVTPDFVADAATVVGSITTERDNIQMLRRPSSYRWAAGPAGAAVAILLLAVGVAATQVNLMDPWGPGVSNDKPTEAGVSTALPEFKLPPARERDPGELIRIAEGSLRETFLTDTPYEVNINAPKRPGEATGGSLLVGPERPAPTATAPGVRTDSPADPKAAAASVPANAADRNVRQLRPAAAHGSRAPTAGSGRVALQVAAFRNLASANELKDRLSKQFNEVYISKITSGGEPLFRVRVGDFADAAETHALRARLQAAGYASFRVTE